MTELLYRRNALLETISARRRRIERLILPQESQSTSNKKLIVAAERLSIPIERIPLAEIRHLSDNGVQQDVLLEVSPYPYADIASIYERAQSLQEAPLVLILDLLQSPGNLGRLLRTAEAVGTHGVVIQKRRAGGVTPAVVAASMGASEHLLIARVTNIARTVEQMKRDNLWVAGLHVGLENQPLTQCDLNRPLALVVGNEAQGLRRLVRDRCDFLINIPMHGHIQSLNAAIAGSLVLYAARTARDNLPENQHH
ncbi:MAG: 23S rRNA (guanosine(2251)-2'-O)-methyltransferase RlmB [Anaerolineales bacterium]|nr:23S rRNA (guanosine(2251)-2'-O)-methyltransferase RlmB [Anaerolineales bacterium]